MALLGRLERFDALLLTSLVWFLGKFFRYAFPPLFGPLQDTYAVSRGTLGAAFTGFMVVYALMQFPSGVLADRFGSVRVITAGGLVAASGALLLVGETPFLVLLVGMLLMGAGTGAHKTVAVRLLSRVYSSRPGRALGVFDTAGSFGGVAAPLAVVAVAGGPAILGASWRTVFLGGGLIGVGLAGAVLARVPARLRTSGVAAADETTTDAVAVQTYLTLFKRPRFTAFVAVTLLFSFAYNGAVAFLPLYLTEAAGLPAATANLLFSALFLASLIQLVTGSASDYVGALPVLTLTLALASLGLLGTLLPAELTSPRLLAGAVVCLGVGAHGFRPVRGVYLTAILPPSVAGGGFGVVRTLLMGAGAVAPAVIGQLSETAGFRPAFWLLVAVLVAATGLTAALWLLDRYRSPA